MRIHKLNVDDLAVESFPVAPASPVDFNMAPDPTDTGGCATCDFCNLYTLGGQMTCDWTCYPYGC